MQPLWRQFQWNPAVRSPHYYTWRQGTDVATFLQTQKMEVSARAVRVPHGQLCARGRSEREHPKWWWLQNWFHLMLIKGPAAQHQWNACPNDFSGKWLKYRTHFLTHFTALLHGERWGFPSVWRHSQLHTLRFNQLKPELDCFFGGQNDNCFSKSEVQPPNYLNWEAEVPLPLVTWSCLTPRFIPPSSQHK